MAHFTLVHLLKVPFGDWLPDVLSCALNKPWEVLYPLYTGNGTVVDL